MVTETKLQDTPVPLSSQRTTGDTFLHTCKGDFCSCCVIVTFYLNMDEVKPMLFKFWLIVVNNSYFKFYNLKNKKK